MSFLNIPSVHRDREFVVPGSAETKEYEVARKFLYRLLDPSDMSANSIYCRSQPASEDPDTNFYRAVKNQIRSEYSYRNWNPDPAFISITSARPRRSVDSFLKDFFLFPAHPDANIYLAAALTIDENEREIAEYLRQRNVVFPNTNWNYYPKYYLYFMLTRFYSYPLSPYQCQLAEIRAQQPEKRIFVDAVFDISEPAMQQLLMRFLNSWEEIPTLFETYGPSDEWSAWPLDYLSMQKKRELDENGTYKLSELADILITWPDTHLRDAFPEHIPSRKMHISRRSWIESLAGKLLMSGRFGFVQAPMFPSDLEQREWHEYDEYDLILA